MRRLSGRFFGAGLWVVWSLGCAAPLVTPPPGDSSRVAMGVWGGAGGIYTAEMDRHVPVTSDASGCAGKTEYLRWRERRQPAFGEAWARLWFQPRARVSPGFSMGLGGIALWRSASAPISETFWEIVPTSRFGLTVRVRDSRGGLIMLEGGLLIFGPGLPLPDTLLPPAVRLIPGIPWVPYATALMRLPLPNGRVHLYPMFLPPGFGGITWKMQPGTFYLFFVPSFFGVEEGDNSLSRLWRRGLLLGGVSVQLR